jgi:hypothetical protein
MYILIGIGVAAAIGITLCVRAYLSYPPDKDDYYDDFY